MKALDSGIYMSNLRRVRIRARVFSFPDALAAFGIRFWFSGIWFCGSRIKHPVFSFNDSAFLCKSFVLGRRSWRNARLGCLRAQGDCHSKLQCEAVSAFTKNSIVKYLAKDAIHRMKGTSFPTLKDRMDPMLENDLWSCTPGGEFPTSCDTDSSKGLTSLTADATEIPGNCFNSSNIDSIGNEFHADDPILGNRGDAIDSSLYRFPLGGISTTGSDLKFLANEHENKESSDLLYYGWPDIGNFEDDGRMFRSCDSTFGQGSAESTQWRNTLKDHELDMTFMVDTVTPLINHSDNGSVPNTYETVSWAIDAGEPATLGHSSYASCLDANSENKGESMSKELGDEINGGAEVKISPVTKTMYGSSVMINLQSNHSKQENQSEGKTKNRSSEYLGGGHFHGPGTLQQFASVTLPSSVPAAPQVFAPPHIQEQKQNLGPDFSFYLHTCNPNVHLEYDHPLHEIPVTPATSSIKSENKGLLSVYSKASSYASNYAQLMERSLGSSPKAPAMTSEEWVGKPHQHQQIHDTVTDDPGHGELGLQVAFTNQVPTHVYQLQFQDEVERLNIEIPAVEVETSTVPKHSCMGSGLLDEMSLEERGFWQLQYVMEQLDIRTKLCIRDSLYRLARSAEQRHNFGNSNGRGRDGSDKNGVLRTEESNKCSQFMDMETGTNLIDQSITHLLFHGPLGASMRAANDALPHELHIMMHGSLASQPVMAKTLVCQEEIAAGAGTELRFTGHE